MEMRGQDKEIDIPTTLGYNLPNRDSSSSSSKLSSPTGERSSDQPHTLIYNDQPQSSHPHHLYPPPPPLAPTQLAQSHRPTSDPDLSTPLGTTSNPPRTATPHTTTTTSTPSIRYRECLRNHAASMGSHVMDGCGEFMASGEDGTQESLRCAACDCHRNFHRKEVEGEQSQPQPQPQLVHNYHNYYPNKYNGHLHYPTPSSSLHHHHRFSHVVATNPTPSLVPPVMMAFGGPAESSSEDLNIFQSNAGAQLSVQAPLSKKRFRTKFSQQQKDRMMEFADKIGWKIQKQNEQEVQQFCTQVGVKRQVFKVWMHNNKQTMKKQQM
ncbi:zinc-finger homeodomain protein 6-like [Abrus precatorius]|uniref:Zinc-finger homeodomain protein 6-like n=1 Tax=Abrus precatorius TaxID=3816 RepID=A0A8B8LZZ3_ABRPR|nr:zinc-finger homeodomain protein 6-like [Abrus precatorius]